MNGAANRNTRAYTMVENAQIFRFCGETNSTVQVVSIAKVDDIAAFSIIEDSIKRATRASNVTVVEI